MQEGIKYVISADVKQAVTGIKSVQSELSNLPKSTKLSADGLKLVAGQSNLLGGSFVKTAATSAIASTGFGGIALSSTAAATGVTRLQVAISGGLLIVIPLLMNKLNEYIEKQKKLNDEKKKGATDTDGYIRKLTQEKIQVEGLVKVIKDQSQAEETRNNALKKLNDILPDSIGKLTQKNIVTAEGVNIIAKYVKSLEAQATAELLINRIAENNIKLFDNRNKQLGVAAEFESKIAGIRSRIARFEAAGKLEVAAELTKTLLATQKEYDAALKEGRVTSQGVLEDNKKIREEYEKILPATITIKKIKEETLKKYRDELDLIEKIGLGEETKFQRDLRNLQEKIRLQEELNRLKSEVLDNAKLIGTPGDRLAGITNDPNAQRQTSTQLDPSALDALQNIDGISKKAKELSDTINNGIGGGIDTFFNALANNQDPFKALAQSVQRLVVELTAAVVKALVLKAITSVISGGASAGGSLLSGLTGGVLRGDALRQLSFLRG